MLNLFKGVSAARSFAICVLDGGKHAPVINGTKGDC